MKKSKKQDKIEVSVAMTILMDTYTYDVLVRQGIRLAMPKKYKDKIIVTCPDFHQSNIPTNCVELPEVELNAFLELAIIDAIKHGIKEAEEKDKPRICGWRRGSK